MRKILAAMAAIATGAATLLPAVAQSGDHVSRAGAFWTWFAPIPDSSTKLVRTPNGLTGQFKTTGLTAGNVVTLWIMFFDNPENCVTPYACVPEIDVGQNGVRFDFHYAGGHVVNGHNTTISGHLQAHELSTSGWAEFGQFNDPRAGLATPLTNPMGAQVILALHDHGPKLSGTTLADQLSSYFGGCNLPFLGDANGFATGPQDLPANEGECSTIQLSFHNP